MAVLEVVGVRSRFSLYGLFIGLYTIYVDLQLDLFSRLAA